MKYASDFRSIARKALRGKWIVAVIAGVIASLLGVLSSQGPKVNLNINHGDLNFAVEYANQEIFSTTQGVLPELRPLILGATLYIVIIGIIMAVVFFVLGSVVRAGYAKFNLDLVDEQTEPEIGTMFGYFSYWKTMTITNLLEKLYVIVWTLLFVIPGIIASYSYAMTSYILAENPELEPNEALELSKQMMSGNRFRLFCLQLSFIGWSILCVFTLGIGNLFLNPYKQAATAAFYREISGTETV